MASDAGESNVAARYASALYELADEKGALDTVAADLTALLGMVDASEDFRRFISSPIISRTEQVKGIAAVGEKGIFNEMAGLAARDRELRRGLALAAREAVLPLTWDRAFRELEGALLDSLPSTRLGEAATHAAS